MEKEEIKFRDIDTKQIMDSFADDDAGQIIDHDEEIVYNEMIWDQENIRLKKESIVLTETEKELLMMLNEAVPVSQITEVEQIIVSDVKKVFQKMCKKLCAKNQKEAFRRARDLKFI
jgi:DNA-binding NarL/FixJ family response regulator